MKTATVGARGAAASVISLIIMVFATACTAPAEPIPGISDAELEKYVAEQREAYWEGLGLPEDTPALDVRPIEYVDEGDWGFVQNECLDGMREGAMSEEIDARLAFVAPEDQEAARENLRWFICEGQYPLELDDIDMMSNAQLTALYEHYQKFTVPCLAAKGYRMNAPPAIEDFSSAGWAIWSPVDSIVLTLDQQMTGIPGDVYTQLIEDCQAQPRVFFGEPWWVQ